MNIEDWKNEFKTRNRKSENSSASEEHLGCDKDEKDCVAQAPDGEESDRVLQEEPQLQTTTSQFASNYIYNTGNCIPNAIICNHMSGSAIHFSTTSSCSSKIF